MSSATKTPDLSKLASPKPPAVKATFSGTFYKTVGGGKGKEYVPFRETVTFPLSAVANQAFTPVALFHKYKADALKQKLGAHSFRYVELESTEGEMPRMDIEHELNWTADHDKLVEIARSLGTKRYVRVDLSNDKKYTETAEIHPELFPSTKDLRQAIFEFLGEDTREAFARKQKKIKDLEAAQPKSMEADIAALGL